MRVKLASGIVNNANLLLLVFLAAACICAALIGRTRINYDLNRYLAEDTMTSRALKLMEEEFGSSEQLRLMFADQDAQTVAGYVSRLNALPEVLLAAHDPEEDRADEGGVEYRLITLTLRDCNASVLVETLRGMFPEAGRYYVGGGAAAQLDLQRSVGREMPLVMGISLAVVISVLLLTSHAWIEPIVILLVLAVSIVINLGTNFVFADVSFITFAVSPILQLALSIDYAIMLVHTWNSFCDQGLDERTAMKSALAETLMRISSSAFTTVAGLMALLFMSFTIGFDIGIVLSKGILISMLCVFALMPSVTLLFRKPLKATRHRRISLGGDRLADAIYTARKPVALLLALLVLAGLILQSRNIYTFTDSGVSSKGESALINSVFGVRNPLALLVPGGDTDEDYDRQRDLAARLEQLEMTDGRREIAEVSSMVTTGAQALAYMTPSDVAELTGTNEMLVRFFFATHGFGEAARADALLDAASDLPGDNASLEELTAALTAARMAFKGKNYDRMLLDVNFNSSDPDLNGCIERIMNCAQEVCDDDFYLTGLAMSTYDIGNAFRTDLLKVNLLTFFAILLIVLISFRTPGIPIMLVFVIEGAIWISMGISHLAGQPVFFMSYLICVAIQMGATIDYGILLCDQFRMFRRRGERAQEALRHALSQALPTVLTSGLILITAGFIIGQVCSIYYISSIGSLLARGTLVSVILVLTFLPALLTLFFGSRESHKL